MMRKLIDKYMDEGGLSGDDWLRLKRHLPTCTACSGYMSAAQGLEQALAYRPPLAAPLALVNSVLLALPPTTASRPPRPMWGSGLLVAMVGLLGLLLTFGPDSYLLDNLLGWLGDVKGAVGNVGQGVSDWVNNPSLGADNFAVELFQQHQTVLLGLCLVTVALFMVLYQTLSAPLPAAARAHRQGAR